MKIDVNEDRVLVLTDVFNTALIETSEGNQMGFCLRDDTIEFVVLPRGAAGGRWWRVNMQTTEVELLPMSMTSQADEDNAPADEPQ